MFITNNVSISWESRKQRTVALSTTEAEYMALSDAAKEAVYLRALLNKIGYPQKVVEIFNDNQGTIQLTKNSMFHKRSKHIDIRFHFIQEVIHRNIIQIYYQPSFGTTVYYAPTHKTTLLIVNNQF